MRKELVAKLGWLLRLLVRIIFSVVFAGIFYAGWMAAAIPAFKRGGMVTRGICWLLAPVVTATGFAIGVVIFELLPGARKSRFSNIFKWAFIGCTVGAGVAWWFGPMLIVFGMFLAGTAGVALREVLLCKKRTEARRRI